MNRRAEAPASGILYFAFFAMALMIFGGLYGGLIAFFGDGYDYRKADSNRLLGNVKKCLENEKFDLTALTKETFSEKCKLALSVLEKEKYWVYINNSAGSEFFLGVADFKVQCGLKARFDKKELPLCSTYSNNEFYILVGSAQNSRKGLA